MGKGGVLGACFDPIIQYVLYGAFALYVLMGIVLVASGAAYMGETGAAGSTGYSLLVIGAFMLVLGGIGIFGNVKQIWLVILVVLLVSLGLFLFLTATIVISILFAMGMTDPVADLVDEGWDLISKGEAQSAFTTPASVCFRYVSECKTYAETYAAIADGALSGCRRKDPKEFSGASSPTRNEWFTKSFSGDGRKRPEYLSDGLPGKNRQCWFPTAVECAKATSGTNKGKCVPKAGEVPASAPTENWCKQDAGCTAVTHWADCATVQAQCKVCNKKCEDFVTVEARAGTEALCFFVLCTVGFIIVAVVWNNFLTRDGNDEFTGTLSLLGYLINAAVLLVGFIMICLCVARIIQSEGYFGLLLGIMFLGVFLLIAGGAAVAGLKLGNPLMIQLASAFLALFGYIMLIIGVALAVCTGYVMGEAQTQYDQNYQKAREQVEKIEPTYCQLSQDQCSQISVFQNNKVPIVKGNAIHHHNVGLTWEQQYLTMQTHAQWIKTTYPSGSTAHLGLQVCASQPVCVACSSLFKDYQTNVKKGKCGGDGKQRCKLSDVGKGTGSGILYDHFFDGVELYKVNLTLHEANSKFARPARTLACTQRNDGQWHSLQDNSIKFGYPTKCEGKHTVGGNSVDCRLGWVFNKGKTMKHAVCENGATGQPKNGGEMKAVATGSGKHSGITNTAVNPFMPSGSPGACRIPTNGFVTLRTTKQCTTLKTQCPSDCNHTTAQSSAAAGYAIDTARLDAYTKKVAAAFRNRTLFNSQRQGGALTRVLGTCEQKMNQWGESENCKAIVEKAAKDDNKNDMRLQRLKGCDKCKLFASQVVVNSQEYSDCLIAMIEAAHPSKTCEVTSSRTACHKKFAFPCTATSCGGCNALTATCKGTTKCAKASVQCQAFEQFRVKMPDSFCQFTDAACQTKMKEKTRQDLKWVGLFGGCFCGFFLVIMYCMYRGMIVYASGDGDDDDE